jgi:multiple antibiotic resistance protein
MFSEFHLKAIFSVTLILFSIIDILGALPIIIQIRKKTGNIHARKATLVAGAIMVSFLFLGESILKLFGVDVDSFALAGALVIFLMGLEMTLDRTIFGTGHHSKDGDDKEAGSAVQSIVPLAFPIIAGAGTMTTILSLRATYAVTDILVGIVLNLIVVFAVLKSAPWLERKLGRAGSDILRKVFGIILIAISIKLVKTYFTFNFL